MTLQFESFPNEIFIHGIFPYLSFIDLHYAFILLNQRFKTLILTFCAQSDHDLHLNRHISHPQLGFTIDSILPFLQTNQQLKSIELAYEDLSLRFLNNISQINTNHLTKLFIRPYIDIKFDSMIQILTDCVQLQEIKLNLMTNLDRTWANGRKLARWFEIMIQTNRQQTLTTIDICVWCINNNDAINFDSKVWNHEGVFRNMRNWKVQIKLDRELTNQHGRRAVEYSRIDEAYMTLLNNKSDSSCQVS